jgi:diaminopimelate dehydrogenase
MEQALSYASAIDCMIIAVGSENDATKAVSKLATRFNTVDCFDMHRYGTKHRKIAENTAKNSNHVSVCMSGWDPGLLSVIRLYLSAFIPGCEPKTFWGEGISQGHTNAVKNIRGVIDAVQYTIPIREAKDAALRGYEYSGVSHKRRCLISCLEGEEKRIEKTIRENEYFHGSDTEIVFVSSPEFLGHDKFYHKGEVIATDRSAGEDFGTLAHFTVEMNSNPDFTAGILLATARAAYKLYNEGCLKL